MDISDEDLNDEFQTFDVSLDNPDHIDKLKLLCQMYRLDAGEIAMEWVAFSHTNRQCALSLDTLEQLERTRLSKKGTKVSKTPVAKKTAAAPIYNVDTIEAVGLPLTLQGTPQKPRGVGDVGILDSYATPTGKTGAKRQHTPDQPKNKRVAGLAGSPALAVPFSPASLSPANATPSKKYSSRTNAGEVVCSFGNCKNITWKSSSNQECSIAHHDPETALSEKFKYMFQKLSDKAIVLNDLIEDMASKLQEHHGIEELAHLAVPVQALAWEPNENDPILENCKSLQPRAFCHKNSHGDTVTVVGRVGCDAQGKLNAKSVELEGSREHSSGKCIAVDLSEVKQYSLFPGQILAMNGINNTGKKFIASTVYEGMTLPLPQKKPDITADGLRVLVACGPFTTSDSLMYEPLADLIKCLQKDPPDVCILLGPFVDVKNPEIEKGNIESTFQDFFMRTIEQIINALQRFVTRLVFVPSQRDAHHEPVYPQPPFTFGKYDKTKVQFVSDPSTITINGVVFGITSTDVLFHLGSDEISTPPGSSDRLARLTQHILTQHNYYPLYPPSEEMNIDYDHFDAYAKLTVTPHVLIIPSDLRFFVKEIKGCCCINPGRLSKGLVGGTYARMYVPLQSNRPFIQTVAAEVVRI